MTDPSPLLSRSGSVDSEIPISETHTHDSSLDDAIEQCMGRFGWTQLLQATLVSFAWAFDAQQLFISVFTEAEPTWNCTQPEIIESCSSATNQCELPKTAWAWDGGVHTSLLSEWDLACAGPFIAGLPASSFFIGCLIGGLLLATLADSSLGRKKMLVLSCLGMSLTGLVTAFSPNIWVYSALRFITGFLRATIGATALVLATELVGKRWRGQVGVIGFLCFTFGFLSLPAIAYLNKDSSWRMLYHWTSIPTIFYSALLHFMGRESPRWLFVQDKKAEAIKVLKYLSNRDTYFTFSYDALSIDKETWNMDLYSGIKIFWQKRWAFRRLSSVMIAGFGIGMVYIGMPLGLVNLKFNLYLSVTLDALSELPAALMSFLLIGMLNRRIAILVCSLVSGICSILCVMVTDKDLQIGMELLSFFCACNALNVLQIYTLELFPTCVRNSALSMVRQAVVLSGVISPVLVAAAGKENNVFWSYGVFGLLISCGGAFVVSLPETRGGSYCDTMDEQENMDIKTAAI